MTSTRRGILQAGAAGLAGAAFADTIAKALALPAQSRNGDLRDVEHVVIFMQENRSFDHYFGALRGVRGFSDPRAIALPGGAPVWRQPDGHGGYVAPFRLDARHSSAEVMHSLDHSWKGSHERWKHHDAWIAAKTPMTMGHFTREDLPFYYALADAFTICDAYHCSIFGPTIPNRLYLFSGTNGVSVGNSGALAVRNPLIEFNETADPANDSRIFPAFEWTTYAERLQAAGVSWKLYQEYDNYGDNGLAYFKSFRGRNANAKLMTRGRSCAAGSNRDNADASRGEHLVAAFAADVSAGRLPAVSWIVASQIMSEHPSGSPSYGQSLTARLIDALTANPDVWSKTVFILNYDENDGFFDHMPPPLPATGAAPGASTVDLAGENYHGQPIGLGPRVPMLLVSPWSKGGWVNSQVFDHTSVLQLLERRFGVAEPNITAWRRAVCGDLTSAFDFATPDAAAAPLPNTARFIADVDAASTLPGPTVPTAFPPTSQENGQRPARALPYALDVRCEADAARRSVALSFANTGAAGAAFNVYASSADGPWFFTVEAGKTLRHEMMRGADRFDLAVHGPNGFFRDYRSSFATTLDTSASYDAASQSLIVSVRNTGGAPQVVAIAPRAYAATPAQTATLATGASIETRWPIADSAHWYDIVLTAPSDPSFLHRLAGHIETGAPSLSDPLIGGAT